MPDPDVAAGAADGTRCLEPIPLAGDDGPRACTARNLLAHFQRGEVCLMPASKLLPAEMVRFSLSTLSDEHGETEIARTMAPFWRPLAAPHPREMWYSDVKVMLDRPFPSLREFIADLRTEQQFKPDTGYTGEDEWNAERKAGCLRACYGVFNAATLCGLRQRLTFLRSVWAHVFNFVWVGWSAGGLHYDEMDNVLAQVAGTKEIVIFPPQVARGRAAPLRLRAALVMRPHGRTTRAPQCTDEIDGGHYVTRFDSRSFFSEKSMQARRSRDRTAPAPRAPPRPSLRAWQASPALRRVPYYHVKLTPGMAVSIPSGAYHAPMATSHDSVSVNSFLAPSLLSWSFPSPTTGRFWCRGGLYRYLGAWCGWLHRWFGVTVVQVGSYKFV